MTIDSFRGEYEFLSNFYPSPVVYDGVRYETVEHAYQAAKTEVPAMRLSIRDALSPAIAKKMGRRVRMRWDWDDVKYGIMLGLVRQKFNNPTLRDKLLATGNEGLEEGNTWGDTYWGTVDGRGANNLGKILEHVRGELRGVHNVTMKAV
jgi:ribA/ribD-fused uncharacterized protein